VKRQGKSAVVVLAHNDDLSIDTVGFHQAMSISNLLKDWPGDAQRALALFRASTGRSVAERWFTALVTDLKQISPEFREWWPRHDVQRVHTGKQELNHPMVGRLVLQSMTLQVIDQPDARLIVFIPLPEGDTEQKLVTLAGSVSMIRVTRWRTTQKASISTDSQFHFN
jgi:hypothetical protein